jgi:hypothetical protein
VLTSYSHWHGGCGTGFRQLRRGRPAPPARQLDAAGPQRAHRHPRTDSSNPHRHAWASARSRLGALAPNRLFLGAWAASTTLAAGILALLGWQAMNSLVSLSGIVVRQTLTPEPVSCVLGRLRASMEARDYSPAP